MGMATFRKPSSKEVALVALLAAFVAGAYGMYAWRNKKEEAFSSLDNLALMSARSSALFFRHFELSLQTLSQDIVATKARLDTPAIHDLLVRFQTNDDRLAVSNLFSTDGQSLSSSNLAVGERISDTTKNVALQAGLVDALNSPGLQIGRPLGGLTGLMLHEMVIPMRYAFRNKSGKPLFVVTAVIPMSKQHEIWQPVSLPDGAAIGLLRDDGVLQGRWPEVADPGRIYAAPNNGVLLDKLRAGGFPDSGRAEGRGTLINNHRLFAFHRVPGYPLTAYVAIPGSTVWWRWLEAVWLPFVLFALMAGCSVWIYRYGARHRALWEQELQARQIGLEFRNEISAHAIQGLGMEELVRIVVRKTVKHFHGMWCAYSTVDAQGLLQVKESSQPEGGPSLNGRTLDLSFVPAHLAALREQRPVVVVDAAGDPVFAPLAGEAPPFRTVSVVNVPLPHPGDMLGVLSVGAYTAHRWQDSEVALLSEIAVYISFSMKEAHSKLEREDALTRLSEGEARFRDLTALSSDWYWEQDENLRFINASQGIFQKLGRDPAGMIGKTRRELPGNVFSENEWNAHQALLDAHLPFHDFTFKRITPEGETRWVSLSGRPIFDAHGNFRGYRGVGKDVTDSKFAEERIEYLAYHDHLTTLPNRSSFSRILDHGIRHAHRHDAGLAVLFIDLDRFKNINDTLGHEAGDLLLQEAGERLKHCVRQSDTVARLGGDEFVVLLEDPGEPGRVSVVARKILSDIARPFDIHGQELRVTASIGISIYPEDGKDEQTLMKRADTAMYHAKQQGKNNFHFHAGRMDTHSFDDS
jgi:diguanylate cyclase (GGDEF)-like protein/PAS domain S-box-containing protein